MIEGKLIRLGAKSVRMQENDNYELTPAPSTKSGASTGLTILAIILLVLSVGAVVAAAYYSTALNTANNTNSNLSSQITALKNAYATANASVTSLNTQVTTLNGQLASDNALISNYTAWVHTLQGTVATLQAQVNADQTTIAQLNMKINDLNHQIDTLKMQMAMDEVQIASLQAQLAAVPRFTSLSGTVAISSFTCGIFSSCTSLAVIFDSQQYGSLSSSVFSGNSYQVFLPSGTIFSVRLYYLSTFFGSTLRTCSGLPSIFATPSGTNSLSQDFTC